MRKPDKPKGALQKALARHLDDEELVQYHDGTLRKELMRRRIALHLELCNACRRQSEDIEHLIQQKATAPTQATPDLPRHGTVPTAVLLRGPQALWQFVQARLPRFAIPEVLPPWHAAAVPTYATMSYPVRWTPESGELLFSITKDDSGFTLTFRSERIEWAGRLIKFTCVAHDDQELLSGFTPLSATFDGHYRSRVHLASDTAERLDREFQVVIDPTEFDALTDADVETLRWSTTLAADQISRQAWRAFSRRLKPLASPGSSLHRWCEEMEQAPRLSEE
jgi:hypothetical protein